jgi:hypothetical protein
MNVKEIVKKYLGDNGYGGLCNDYCGCTKENLILCCSEGIENCEPGYKRIYDANSSICRECDGDCDHDKKSLCIHLIKQEDMR